MREELSLVRKLLPHLALTKSVLSAQHDLLDVIFHHSFFRFLETYVTLLHDKSMLPSPVISVMHGKGILLHLDLKTFLIKLR